MKHTTTKRIGLYGLLFLSILLYLEYNYTEMTLLSFLWFYPITTSILVSLIAIGEMEYRRDVWKPEHLDYTSPTGWVTSNEYQRAALNRGSTRHEATVLCEVLNRAKD